MRPMASARYMPMTAASSWQSENRRADRSCDLFVISAGWAFFFRKNVVYLLPDDSVTEEGDTGYYTENKEETETYIKQAKENSLYDYDVDVNGNDKIISLVTCTRYFGIDGPTQFRVDLRKVRDDEKITKSKVTTTDNYDIIK